MIKIFFECNNEIIQLPVNPEELKVARPGNNASVETIKLGELNILKLPKLASLSIDSIFPLEEGLPFIATTGKKFKKPSELVQFFENARDTLAPVRFKVVGDNVVKSKTIVFAVDDFSTNMQAMEEDVLYYTLVLKEYKNYASKTFSTDFEIPVDEEGNIKVAVKQTPKLQNAWAKLKQAAKKAENGYRVATRAANQALNTVNTIQSTGSVIKSVASSIDGVGFSL